MQTVEVRKDLGCMNASIKLGPVTELQSHTSRMLKGHGFVGIWDYWERSPSQPPFVGPGRRGVVTLTFRWGEVFSSIEFSNDQLRKRKVLLSGYQCIYDMSKLRIDIDMRVSCIVCPQHPYYMQLHESEAHHAQKIN